MKKTQNNITLNSAIPGMKGDIQLNIAYKIWKILEVNLHTFFDIRAMTEKELSIKTWGGCTEEKYDEDPEYWKHQNSRVIDYIYAYVPSFKIVRFSERIKGDNFFTVKICKSDRKRAKKTQKHLLDISTGCTSKAIVMNEVLEIGTDIGKEIYDGIIKRLPNNYTGEKKKELALEVMAAQIYKAGLKDGQENAVKGLLDTLKDDELEERNDIFKNDDEEEEEETKNK